MARGARATIIAPSQAMVVVALLAASSVARAAPVHHVEIRNNFFQPPVVRVDPGDTVRWTMIEGIHTVTSEDGLFASGAMDQPGQTFAYVTPNDDVRLDYFCSIHGAAMSGVIIVGDPPTTTRPVEVRVVPSSDWPSLWDALNNLDPAASYRIELAPGTHTVDGREIGRHTRSMGNRNIPLPRSFELTIRGVGAAPDDVIIQGGLAFAFLQGLHLERVMVTGGSSGAAVMLGRDARRWFLDDVQIQTPGSYGVHVLQGAGFGRIHNVMVSSANVAGIAVQDCMTCDVLIDGVTVTDSLQGVAVLNGTSVIIRGSTLSDNGAGISVKTTAGQQAPSRGVFIGGNMIDTSTSRARAGAPSASLDLPVGHGVWLHGASFAEVIANTITGASLGVAVTGPSTGHRVIGNTMSDTVDGDLGWDGLGVNVCFADNQASGRALTSMPPEAQTLYPCDRPVTVGVPYPLVLHKTLAWGLGLPAGP